MMLFQTGCPRNTLNFSPLKKDLHSAFFLAPYISNIAEEFVVSDGVKPATKQVLDELESI